MIDNFDEIMPQHLEIKTAYSHLMVWKITEPIIFFEEKLSNWQNDFHQIKCYNNLQDMNNLLTL